MSPEAPHRPPRTLGTPGTPGTPGTVVTRFAPSPTGYLHIGGARTALFNWAFAKRHGGTFILRMEDTDVARSTDEATRKIIEDLQWLGLNWDEGPNPASANPKEDQIGDHGSYFQSQRGELYRQYLEKLRALGRVYDDKGAVRFKMPEHDITVHDLVLGDVTIKREQLEDFIIFKGQASGGGPTFHFANVVDDATMSVTHVLRAQEHLMNTPKHLALFEALGITPPQYAHMPLIFNIDGSKMSKRDKAKAARHAAHLWLKNHGNSAEVFIEAVRKIRQMRRKYFADIPPFDPATVVQFLEKKNDDIYLVIDIAILTCVNLPEIDVYDFRRSGYLVEVLLNYIALLGWNPGDNTERFDLAYLQREFDIERLGKSNAKFDRAKLLAFNAETLQKTAPETFQEKLHEHLQTFHPEFGKLAAGPQFGWFAAAYQQRAKTLDDPAAAGRFFVTAVDEITFDPKAVDKVLKKSAGAGWKTLRELLFELEKCVPFAPAQIHQTIESFAARTQQPMGDVAQPVRVAVTGGTVSPPLDLTLAILGKEDTMKRIQRCLELCSP